MSHHRAQLQAAVIEASEANNWEDARAEWEVGVMWEAPHGQCTCGYNPIRQHNLINNTLNGNTLVVGRVCIKQFFDLPEIESLWSALDRLKADPSGTIPIALVREAADAGWLNDRESEFLHDIYRKRNLSDKQLSWRKALARRILHQVKSQGGQG